MFQWNNDVIYIFYTHTDFPTAHRLETTWGETRQETTWTQYVLDVPVCAGPYFFRVKQLNPINSHEIPWFSPTQKLNPAPAAKPSSKSWTNGRKPWPFKHILAILVYILSKAIVQSVGHFISEGIQKPADRAHGSISIQWYLIFRGFPNGWRYTWRYQRVKYAQKDRLRSSGIDPEISNSPKVKPLWSLDIYNRKVWL